MFKKGFVVVTIGVFFISILLYFLSVTIDTFQDHTYQIEDIRALPEFTSYSYLGRKESFYANKKIELQVNGSWMDFSSFLLNHAISMKQVLSHLMEYQEGQKKYMDDNTLYEIGEYTILECSKQKVYYLLEDVPVSNLCASIEK